MRPHFRAIRLDEFDRCLDLWDQVFRDVPRKYFEAYFYGDPRFRRAYTRVCALDGRLVSAVQVCERRVRIGSAELVMGGIGNVATDSDFRGRGYNTRLLKDSIRIMRRYGMDFSVLFTGIHPFYERLGWRPVAVKSFTGKIKPRLRERETDKYSIRACDFSTDLDGIKEAYEAFNRLRPLTVCRTPEYWTGYALPRFGEPADTLVAESAGSVTGYVVSPCHRDNCSVREIGCIPGHEGCIGPLITRSAARARERGVTAMWFHVPEEPEILAAARRVTNDLAPRESLGMMCRVIDMESLGRRLLPELNRRAARRKLPPGSFSLDTEMGSLALTIRNGQVTIGMGDGVHVAVSQPEFFCLLFGLKSADELGLPIPGDVRQMLLALFPVAHPVFYLQDHF